MSEETTQSTENAAGAAAGKRPAFLTVLCILSFIASGIAIVGYVLAIGAVGVVSAGASMMEGMEGMEGMGEVMEAAGPSVGMLWANIIGGLIMTIVALLGVIKMWKLKKQGFMMYAGASIVALILGFLAGGFSVFSTVITLGFIVMYYLNVKHMS